MRHRLGTRRSVAGALALAITVVVSATCLSAERIPPAQRACCAAMAHQCGEIAIKEGCCLEKKQDHDGLAALSAATFNAPISPIVAILEMPLPRALSGTIPAASAFLKPPGAPTYVLVSSFRI